MSEATVLLAAVEQGDSKAAEELLELVYDELRRLAAGKMRSEVAPVSAILRSQMPVRRRIQASVAVAFDHYRIVPSDTNLTKRQAHQLRHAYCVQRTRLLQMVVAEIQLPGLDFYVKIGLAKLQIFDGKEHRYQPRAAASN